MPTPPITGTLLDGFLSRNIKDVCTEVRLVDNKLNHCAHFVNHVLGFDHPLTCGGLLGRPGPRPTSASTRPSQNVLRSARSRVG